MASEPIKCSLLARQLMRDYVLLEEARMSLYQHPNLKRIYGAPQQAERNLSRVAAHILEPEEDQVLLGSWFRPMGNKVAKLHEKMANIPFVRTGYGEEPIKLPEDGLPIKDEPRLTEVADELWKLADEFLSNAVQLICTCEKQPSFELQDKEQEKEQGERTLAFAEGLQENIGRLGEKLTGEE